MALSPSDALSGDVTDPLGPLLRDLALLALGLSSEFFLTVATDPDTIRVRVALPAGGVVLEPEDWTCDARRNSIRFVEYVPAPGTRIEIVYGAAG